MAVPSCIRKRCDLCTMSLWVVARNLAEATRLGSKVKELRLSASQDVVCANLMCEKVSVLKTTKPPHKALRVGELESILTAPYSVCMCRSAIPAYAVWDAASPGYLSWRYWTCRITGWRRCLTT